MSWLWLPTEWLWAAAALYAVSLGLVPRVLLSRSSQPSGKVAWLLTIAFVPAVGGLLYLVFAAGRDEVFAAAKRDANDELTGLLPDPDEEDPGDAPPALRAVWDLAGELAGQPAAGGNAVRVFADAAEGLHRVVAAVEGAERSVSVLFYIYRSDEIGTRLRDAMTAAAKRGVAVRLLFDRFGSLGLTRAFLRPLTDAGGRAEPFQPRGNGVADRLRLNLRNHRKIVVVDGAVGFTGGANVGDEYLSRDPATAPWRDTVAEVRGPAAGRLMRVFAQDWLYAAGERLADPALYGGGAAGADVGDEWTEDVVLRVLDDGPDRRDRAHECVFAAAIHAAAETVDLSTGYFLPTAAIDRALQCAARRGVRVRVLHGGPGSPTLTRHAARWGYADLLDAGVRIHERRAGTLHAKTLTVDDRFSLIGTANCDPRSMRLNFEVSLVGLDARLAGVLTAQFAADLPTADRVDPAAHAARPAGRKLGEAACALFAPVL